ncbi:putative Protein kinase [Leptomonas seymouri]|uniref:non-specific serine/threonine protein kinase n=1 Tax=Leptomonas seymouri TaxID=5684 RepID=A0A0N1PD87_LEPSE|nr:putative Protein kinase [Leptomonas seymouri]|eukprot:KPI88464.1 putative Protein kinase [Leptomonas seymouri]
MGMEHYTKVRDLGGTNGAFLARDRQQPDRLVVIKRLADGTQGMEELNASLRLRHPHVIRFLESFLSNGGLYVVTHYEPGGDLDELFRYLKDCHKTPTTHTLLLWFVQLLDALTFSHTNHVIHRDIKPSNILVSEDTKMLYLADFGSAKTLGTSNVTSTFVGSPLWISPEVLMGTNYSFAADIWSLGCVFYEMTTLRKPFSAPSFAHLVQQVTRGQIAPLPPNVAPEVRPIILSMLQLHPAERTTAAAALEAARTALAKVESQRNMSPTPVRSPIPAANVSAASSPLNSTPLVPSSSTVAPSSAPPQVHLSATTGSSSDSSASTTRVVQESQDADNGSRPPEAHSDPPAHTAALDAITPLADVLDAAAPASSVNSCTRESRKVDIPQGAKSPTAIVIKRRHTGGTPSASALTRSSALKVPPTATAEDAPPAAEESNKPCELQPMVLNISTGAFRKPVMNKRPVVTRTAAVKQPAGPAHPSRRQQQLRQQLASVPTSTPEAGASSLARQPTPETLPGRRRSATNATEVINKQCNGLSGQGPKVGVKAAPPRALASRAKAAAENPSDQRYPPRESPTRAAAVPPPPLIGGAGRRAPEPSPMVATAAPPKNGDRVPADQWLDERMRELSAMEKYLYQHRVGDNKVLQTYDARRNEEYQQQESAAAVARPPPRCSPAQRRMSPSKAYCSPTRSAGVLVMSPPASHASQQQQQRSRHGAVSDPRAASAASPLPLQASYARQESYARHPSRTGVQCDSRPGSLASTFNGRQASNARPHQPISEEEYQRLEEERAAAREKRETERQRMKELIREQRAAAKKQKRKPKKGSGKGVVEIDIVLPDHKHFTADDAAAVA